jgi:carboxymethylenebutenolidase
MDSRGPPHEEPGCGIRDEGGSSMSPHVREEKTAIAGADGAADGCVFRPETGGPHPGVLHLTDIGGIRPAHRDMGRRLAAAGYVVLMPNVFYRTRVPPMFEPEMKAGEDAWRARFAELVGPLTPEAQERDAAAYVDDLGRREDVREGAMGVVGYCFTGPFVMRVAAAGAGRISAAASFHGGGLWTDASASPHLVLPRVSARLYFAHAIEDRSMPPEAIANLEAALAAWGGHWESEVYEGARHGWTASNSAVYDEAQANRAFTKLTDLFRETL